MSDHPKTARLRADHHEIEAKLVVVSERAERILLEIAGLAEIAGDRLMPAAAQTIRDSYYDTRSADLQCADLALRIRHVDGACQVALKGKSRRVGEAVERLEIEYTWSPEAFDRIAQVLREHGIDALSAGADPGETPEKALARLGLTLIQGRETHRLRRRIVKNNTTLGEMALDHVVYRSRGRKVHHYEIELESDSSSSVPAVNEIASALIARYSPAARPWYRSKVATGVAIDRLIDRPGADVLLNRGNRISQDGYDAIERILSEELQVP